MRTLRPERANPSIWVELVGVSRLIGSLIRIRKLPL
jgi:hypothetical protein